MDAHPVSHPTDRTLQAFGLGQLDAAAAESVSAHLVGCPHCRQRVVTLSSAGSPDRVHEASMASAHGLSLLGATTGGAAPPPADSLPPGLADHPDYEVVSELGRGGMGVVYLARNKLMGRLEVLKVVSAHLVKRRAILDRFLGEIQNAARLHHPNIVVAYTAQRLGESLMLAMEYVDGLDLAKIVKTRGPLSVARACNYVHQAALGLQHAHEHGMVHRDIKPGNLMLAKQGNRAVIKVLDFGLAKVQSEKSIDSGLTHEGQMLGTPDYIAPEQISDARHADIRADIYSLGCTLYYLLTGKPPFQGNSLYDLLQAHHSMEATPLNLVRPDVPVEVAAIVAKMMAKEAERRFQQPSEVAQALRPFAQPGDAASAGSKSVDRLPKAVPPPPVPVAGPPGSTEAASPWATLIEAREEPRPRDGRQMEFPGRGTTLIEPREEPHPGRQTVSAPALAAIAAAAVLLLATLTAALWNWVGRSRDRAGADRISARPAEPGPIAGPASESGPKATGPGPRPEVGHPEDPVRDALAAVRGGNLNRARLLLDRYLSRPQSGKQVDAARALRDDLDLATSSVEAQAQAQHLSDQEIKDYLETGVQSLVDSNVQTPELRSVYAQTLLKAFRHESSRRQSAPKSDVSLARGPEPGPSRAPVAMRKAPSAVGIAPASGKVPDRTGPTTIATVLDSPGAFVGQTILLDGLYRVGTRLTPVIGPDGNEIGVSLPVARDDDRLICRGDGRIVGRDGYLVLDRSLAPHLLRGFDEYKFHRAAKPEHKSTLTVTVSRMGASNSGAPVVSIVGLEVLGVCNLLRVAEGHYENSFLTLRVTPGTSSVAYGDGAAWVERLGGEERFLRPLHRKLRELKRKMVAERINAATGPYLQAALAQSMNMAIANAQQQSRMIQSFTGRR